MQRAISILIALVGSVATYRAHATDRYFSDETATSGNGRWRVEAKSPDNVPDGSGRRRPFASNFVYSLTDTKTGKVLWTRRQPEKEMSPTSLFVNDESWVVVRTAWDELIGLKALTGEQVVKLAIKEQLTEEERAKFVRRTTAGEFISGSMKLNFLSRDGVQYFVVRFAWDRRLIMDLTHGRVMTEIPPDLAAACDASDREFALRTLRGAFLRVEYRHDDDYQVMHDVYLAMHLAGRMKLNEAVADLRELERSNYSGTSGGWWDTDGVYDDGDINPFNSSEADVRRAAHLTLRLLGEKPNELPCTWFSVVGAQESRTAPKGSLPGPRAERIDLVKPGMKPMEVLDAIGAPDEVSHQKKAWVYHMDVAESFTLLVIFEDKKVVGRLERVTPPTWRETGWD